MFIASLALAAALHTSGPVIADPTEPHLVTVNGYVCMIYPDALDAPVCDQYEVDLTVEYDYVAHCLGGLGWSGSDDDGHAVMYAPSSVIENCIGTEI